MGWYQGLAHDTGGTFLAPAECLSLRLCPPALTLSAAEAAALERELLEDYRFGRQQLVEWCGHASAVAVTKVPGPASQPRPRADGRSPEWGPSCMAPLARMAVSALKRALSAGGHPGPSLR